MARETAKTHCISIATAERVCVEYDGERHAFKDGLPATKREGDAVMIKLAPGCQDYFDAQAYHGRPVPDDELVAAAIVAAVVGHPDAEEARRGTVPSAVWSHHLAIVRGDDPRAVQQTYARTKVKTISAEVQRAAVLGVRVCS